MKSGFNSDWANNSFHPTAPFTAAQKEKPFNNQLIIKGFIQH